MAYVVTQPCIGVKDRACTEVCPVECIHDAGEQFVIQPEECIDCGSCMVACPVGAIFYEGDIPAGQEGFILKNRSFFGL